MRDAVTDKKKWTRICTWIIILLFLYIQHVQLEYSTCIGIKSILLLDYRWLLMNLLAISIFSVIFYVLTGTIIAALGLSGLVITILSLINYHVTLFHGSAFFASDFFSIPTAMSVLGEYSVSMDSIVLRLIAIAVIEAALLAILHIIIKNEKRRKSHRGIAAIVLSAEVVVLWITVMSPWRIFKEPLIKWAWETSVNNYGYELCFLDSARSLFHSYNQPDGYSPELINVSDDISSPDSYDDVFPDIILILNETLCDISYYSTVAEGRTVLEPIYQIPGIVSGYSTVSLIGGGTNNSEYELLTSNSMAGLSISAPFLVLNMHDKNSIVSYLDKLGYYSVGMHCGDKTNYNRNTAYPAIGFCEVFLGPDNFTFNKYGNRRWYDIDNYKDMEAWYTSCNDSAPRFMYLLTFQNHGSYEQNGPEYDTISIKEDLGDYTDDANEYLTSIDESSRAFVELTQYFASSDRKVVILMVGDHAPSFINDIPSNGTYIGMHENIAKRTVPYFVWSNMDIDESVFPEYTSMVDLVPLLLKSVNMPLSAYYKTIIELNEKLPVRMSDGIGMDLEGNAFEINDEWVYYDLFQKYTFMEYNNLKKGGDYMETLFLPQ